MSTEPRLYVTAKSLLENLTLAASAARTGDARAANAAILQAKPALADLAAAFAAADTDIGTRLTALETRIGSLSDAVDGMNRTRTDLKRTITDLTGNIADAETKETMDQATLTNLNVSLDALRIAAKAHQDRLEEVRKWWWVPIYGTVISIKALVDDDIGEIRLLRSRIKTAKAQKHDWAVKLAGMKSALRDLRAQLDNARTRSLTTEHARRTAQRDLLVANTRSGFLGFCRTRIGALAQLGGDIAEAELPALAETLAGLDEYDTKEGLSYLKKDGSDFADAVLSFALAVDNGADYLTYTPPVANVIRVQNRGAFVFQAQAVRAVDGRTETTPWTPRFPVMQSATIDLRNRGWQALQIFHVEGSVMWGTGEDPRTGPILFVDDARPIELDLTATGNAFDASLVALT